MGDHMAAKEVGSINTLHGSMDNIQYDLFFLKETNYTMNVMSTYGGFLVPTGQKHPTGA